MQEGKSFTPSINLLAANDEELEIERENNKNKDNSRKSYTKRNLRPRNPPVNTKSSSSLIGINKKKKETSSRVTFHSSSSLSQLKPREKKKIRTKSYSTSNAKTPTFSLVKETEDEDEDDENKDEDKEFEEESHENKYSGSSLPFILAESKRKKPTKIYASGRHTSRIEGGMMIVDDIHEDFKKKTPQQLDNDARQPWAYSLEPEEIDEVRQWELKRASAKARLKSDKLHEYIRHYAALTRRQPSQLISTPLGQRTPRLFQGGFLAERNRSIEQTRGPPSLVEGGAVFGGTPTKRPPSVEKPVLSPIPTSPVFKRRAQQFVGEDDGVNGDNNDDNDDDDNGNGGGLTLPIIPSAEEQRILAEMERGNSERLYSATSWISEPQVIGIQDLSEDVVTYATIAFSVLKRENSNMQSVKSFYDLIFTDVSEIRALFAQLAALEYAGTAFMFPTRNTFQLLHAQIREQRNSLRNFLGEFTWDSWKNDFRPMDGSKPIEFDSERKGFITAIPTPQQIMSNY